MIDLNELREAIKKMTRQQAIYRLLRDELSKQGRWKYRGRGKPNPNFTNFRKRGLSASGGTRETASQSPTIKEVKRKMTTVSEIGFYQGSVGKCPQCGRERPLGHINILSDIKHPARCIDCCFGPAMEYWDECDSCGQLYVGDHCDNPKCPLAPKEDMRKANE